MIQDMFPGSLPFSGVWRIILAFFVFGFTLLPIATAVSPEILEAALPTAADSTPGLDMHNPPGITSRSDDPQYFFLVYGWDGYFRFTCQKKSGRIDSNPGDWFKCSIRSHSIDNAASAQTLATAEVWKDWIKGRVEPYTDYPGLSDSVWYRVTRTPSDTNYQVEEEIAFWVDPHTYIEVEVNGNVNSWSLYDEYGCTPSVAERKSRMDALVSSEAYRIARLVRNKLPASTPIPTRDYGELIWTLRYYLPNQFGSYPDDVLYKALVINESGVLGKDQGITYAIRDNMMRDISDFKESLSTDVPGWQGRLVDEAGENAIGKEIEDTMGVMDVAQSYLTAVDAGLGYETGIVLPEFGPIYGLLGLYRELEKKMRFYRDNIVIPDIADEIYLKYKAERAAQISPKEAFDDAIYGSNAYYQLRSYPVFAQWTPEDLDLVLAERFEQRYHTEELLDLRSYMLEHGDLFVKGIIWQYREKLDRLERTCQAISDGRIKVDIPYEPNKIEKWWYLPKELRGE